ncbi:MAG: biopolymer transporter ExbD [Verrucomicrobiales bacterium]|nr:biopolymer transporter ExbD [Verrucomicrobiales bacterium]
MNADALLHWLLVTTLEGSLLIGGVLGLRRALGNRLRPIWRLILWRLAALKLLLPAFIPAGFGMGCLWAKMSARLPVSDEVNIATPMALDVAPASTGLLNPTMEPLWLPSWSSVFVLLWLAGVVCVLAWAIVGQLRFDRALRGHRFSNDPALLTQLRRLALQSGIRRCVSVRLMPKGTTPAVTGIRCPTVLLPEDWEQHFSESRLRHVLLHELQHVRHHDLVWNWMTVILQALHWFNPIVWFALPHYRADAELRCDAGALSILSPSERLDYGHTLLRIQNDFFAPPAIAGLAPCVRQHPSLRQRIHMIAAPTATRPLIQSLILAAIGLIALGSFATSQAEEKALPPKERSREGQRAPSSTPRESERSEVSREGANKSSEREGDRPRSAEREGDKANRTGMRDGEGAARTGPRDGDGKPKTGERDGDRPRTGERDGDRARTGSREGDAKTTQGEQITLHVSKDGEVKMGRESLPMNRLRGYLRGYFEEHPNSNVIITGDPDTPYKMMTQTLDAVRDSGNKSVRIGAE